MRAAWLCLLLAACGVDFADGQWHCGAAGECPPGLACHRDGMCYRQAEAALASPDAPPAAEVAADAALASPDAMLAPPSPDAAEAPPDAAIVPTPPDAAVAPPLPDAAVAPPPPDAAVAPPPPDAAVAPPPDAAVPKADAAPRPDANLAPDAPVALPPDAAPPPPDAAPPPPDAAPPPPVTLTLTVAGSGTGTLDVEPAGTSCGSGCFAYPAGTTVAVTPQPALGSRFTGLSNGCTDAPCSIFLGADTSLAATFEGGGTLMSRVLVSSGTGPPGTPAQIQQSAVASDSSGAVIVVGYFIGTADFGDGHPFTPSDGCAHYVAKYAADGSLRWKKIIDNAEQQCSGRQAVGVGSNDSVLWADGGSVAKYTAGGGDVWVRTWATASIGALAVASDDSIILAGNCNDSNPCPLDSDHSAAGNAAFVGRLQASGTQLDWATSLPSNGLSRWETVVFDGTTVAAGGFFYGTLDIGGQSYSSPSNPSPVVARYDAAGALQSASVFLQASGCLYWGGPQVALDGANLVIGLSTSCPIDVGQGMMTPAGFTDIVLAKLDSAGHPRWSRMLGSEYSDKCSGVRVAAKGDIVIAGYSSGIDLGGGGFLGDFVARLGPDGTAYRWSRTVQATQTTGPVIADYIDDGTATAGGIGRIDASTLYIDGVIEAVAR
jgi:hypothetical protein